MKNASLSLLLCVAWCGGALAAAPPRAQQQEPNIWGGLGGGGYTGQNYPADNDPNTDDEHTKVGGFSTHATFNVDGDYAGARIRWSHLFNFTSNAADEIAGELSLALDPDRKIWAAAGVARLDDVSNTRKAPTVGFPLELRFYPVRGLELMVHANFNGDSNYVGVGVGGAIGRRPRR